MTVTKVQREALVNFAKFCDEQYDALEPWTPAHHTWYKALLPAYGGVSSYASGASSRPGEYVGPVYTYTPMSVAEFEEASGKKLDPEYDTGGKRSWWEETLMTIGSGESPRSAAAEFEMDKWDEFYAAGGKHSGGEWTMNTSGMDAPWANAVQVRRLPRSAWCDERRGAGRYGSALWWCPVWRLVGVAG